MAAGGPLYDTIDYLIYQLEDDLEIVEGVSKKSVLTAIDISKDLDDDVVKYLGLKLEGIRGEKAGFNFVQCRKCTVLRAEAEGNEIFIKKGITDHQELKRIARTYGASSYTEAALVYTGTQLKLAVNIYGLEKKDVLWSKTYSLRLLNLSKSGMVGSLTFHQGFGMGEDGKPYGASFSLSERVYGMGTLGLNVMGFSKHDDMQSYYGFGPLFSLSFNEIFNTYSLLGSMSWEAQLAYGFYDDNREITFGTGLKMLIGSTFHMTLRYLSGTSLEDKRKNVDAYPGTVFLGFGMDF